MSEKLSKEDGKKLLELARETISRRLTGDNQDDPALETEGSYKEKRATFVTLKIKNQLRGCIGCLSPYESLSKSIESNAINAAFNDARFSPLTIDELDKTHIEISILTPSAKLDYKDPDDLLKQLRPGVDGVILKSSGRSATFLPQVWEQLPTVELFLSHLCKKAGLRDDLWKHEKVEVEIYQVQSFEEEGK